MATRAFVPVQIPVAFEMEFSGVGGGWTDVTADVLVAPAPSWSWGISGTGPLDLVSSPGSMSLSLNNSALNSGAKEGYYSVGHTNQRSGFEEGIGIRVTITRDAVEVANRYTIKTLHHGFGPDRMPVTEVHATDWMDLSTRIKLPGLDVAADQTEVQAYQGIRDEIPSAVRPQDGMNLLSSFVLDSYPFIFDNADQQTETVTALLQKLAQSHFATIVRDVETATLEGEVLYLQSRGNYFTNRQPAGSAINVFDNDMVDFRIVKDRDRIINVIDITQPVRRSDDDNQTVLYSIDDDRPTVQAGSSITLFLDYRDPANEAERVSGTDMVNPVATTDFTMNGLADGTGVDLTSSHTVTPTFAGSSVKLVVANTGSDNSVVTKLSGRGRGLYAYTDRHTRVEDATSVAKWGERLQSFRTPWNTDPNFAKQLADWLLTQYKDEDALGVSEATLRYNANRHDDFHNWTINQTIGRAVAVTEDVSGADDADGAWWIIQHITMTWINADTLMVDLRLQRKEAYQAYWELGATASDDLDTDTKLGYF